MLDDFFTRALLAGVGLAIVTGPTGCFVVWRRLAYFGETIAHSALLGVAVAIVLDIDLAIGIFAAASAVVLIMFYLERSGRPAHGHHARPAGPWRTLAGPGGAGLLPEHALRPARAALRRHPRGDARGSPRHLGWRRRRPGGAVVDLAPAAGRHRERRSRHRGGATAGTRAAGVRVPWWRRSYRSPSRSSGSC